MPLSAGLFWRASSTKWWLQIFVTGKRTGFGVKVSEILDSVAAGTIKCIVSSGFQRYWYMGSYALLHVQNRLEAPKVLCTAAL